MFTTTVQLLVLDIVRRVRSQRGATLTEYALLVSLIAVACIGAIEFLGDTAADKLTTMGSEIGQP